MGSSCQQRCPSRAERFQVSERESVIAFFIHWRIALPPTLFLEPEATIASVARQVGYSSPFALSFAFKRVRGVSPHQRRGAAARRRGGTAARRCLGVWPGRPADDPQDVVGVAGEHVDLLRSHDVVVGPAMRWLTVAAPGDAHELLLVAIEHHVPTVDQDAMREIVAKGTLPVFLQVDDVDAVFESLRAAGVEVLQEPIDQGYGIRDCAVRDPNGDHVRLSQPLAAGARS